MKISTKARYGLAAMISIARDQAPREYTTLISISEKLGISKIYLEQVFSLLKQARLVNSIKGSQGGYQLSRAAGSITVFDILSAIEFSLFQKTEATVSSSVSNIEDAMQTAFHTLDQAVRIALQNITLQHLADEAAEDEYMFFI